MSLLPWILPGLAPGLLWLLWFRWKDTEEREPAGRLLGTFLAGGAAGLALLATRGALLRAAGADPVAQAFMGIALPEESLKLLAFLVAAGLSRDLDEPMDGIVYGAAAGLGFASLENVLYLHFTGDPELVFLRGFTATLAHAAFTGLAGYGWGRFHLSPRAKTAALAFIGLFFAVLLHGLYDVLLERGGAASLLGLLLVLPATLLILAYRIRRSREESPFREPSG